jgi:uncharacterized protein (DUF2237 family)
MKKVTGYSRDGFCSTVNGDTGTHVVCAIMDDEFLQYMLEKDNDLITPRGKNFPGLVAGDRWCVCALRWMQAYRAGKAPRIIADSTNMRASKFIPHNIMLDYQA